MLTQRTSPRINLTPDVLVVGGGSAGVAAARNAAASGCSVTLLERGSFLGGMATSASVGTVCGYYYRSPKTAVPAYSGFVSEFVEELRLRSGTEPMQFDKSLWFLPYDPIQFRLLCDEQVSQSNVQTLFHSVLCGIDVEKSRIAAVSVFLWDRMLTLRPKFVIDCSGEGVVSSLAESSPLSLFPSQASALVFEVRGLEKLEPQFVSALLTRELLRALEEKRLPSECRRLSVVPGSVRDGSALLKLGLDPSNIQNALGISETEIHSRRLALQVVNALASRDPQLHSLRLHNIAAQVGVRSGFRARGRAVLTEADVLECRKSSSSVAYGTWPIEIWGTERKPEMRYFAEDESYDIPLGALESVELENLLFAGRCISADDSAIASARVIATCLHTGTAAGSIAAARVRGESVNQNPLSAPRSSLVNE